MKKFWIKPGAAALALMMALVFAGCDAGGLSGVGRVGNTHDRSPVADGVFYVETWGYNRRFPVIVRTVFARNAIVNVQVVGNNAENRPMMDSIRERLIPRIIQSQSLNVDTIAGSTMSSQAVLDGVRLAIEKANGDPEDWMRGPILRRGLVQMHDFDVIVVGLGGSGTAAFLAASEHPGTSVFGLEAAGKVGGNSALAGGPMAVNSWVMMDRRLPGPAPTGPDGPYYINRNALLQQWWSDMQAEVPAYLGMRHTNWDGARMGTGETRLVAEHPRSAFQQPRFHPPFLAGFGGASVNSGTWFNLPRIDHDGPAVAASAITPGVAVDWAYPRRPIQRTVSPVMQQTNIRGGQPHRDRGGGARWDVVRYLVDRSGPAWDWLVTYYDFIPTNFGGLSFPQFLMVQSLGWNVDPSTAGVGVGDDTLDIHKTATFHRALTTAAARHPRSDFQLELRAMELITVPDPSQVNGVDIVGVRARSWDGTIYEIFGRTVVLATGGFIANPDMVERYIGVPIPNYSVGTHRGDGIRMARSVGAATYNIDMSPMHHTGQVRNVVQTRIRPTRDEDELWKGVLSSLLIKRDNISVALAHGPGYMDLRGRRFVNDATDGFSPDGHDFAMWRAGGLWGALFCQARIDHMTNHGAHAALAVGGWAHNQGGWGGSLDGIHPGLTRLRTLWPANRPIYFLPELLDIMEVQGNVIFGNSLLDLAQEIWNLGGAPGYSGVREGHFSAEMLALRLRETILHYNDLYGWNYDGSPRIPGSDPLARSAAFPWGGALDNPAVGSGMGGLETGVASWAKWNLPADVPGSQGRLNFTYPQVAQGRFTDDPQADIRQNIGFTMILGVGWAYGTSGGLDINVDMQVLHYNTYRIAVGVTRDFPIRGLYAVGHDSQGVLYSRENPYSAYGAVAYGFVLTGGRRAGINAAAEAELMRAGRH